MSRIAATFARLRQQGRKALIPYVMAGFPYADVTPELMHGMVAAGADVIELGVPFSDPSADGPVIQQAGDRALALGINLARVLDMVRAFRQQDSATPVVLMGYANPIEHYELGHGGATLNESTRAGAPGFGMGCEAQSAAMPSGIASICNEADRPKPGCASRDRLVQRCPNAFARDAAAAGVDGVLVVDYPPEECEPFAAQLKAAGLDMIFLLAPTSTDARIAQVARSASGYVYYVSLKGVTGSGALDVGAVQAMLPRIRAHVSIPVGVGFGIRDAATARAIGQSADAVVIGSRLLQAIAGQPRERVALAAGDFLRAIRAGLDGQPSGG